MICRSSASAARVRVYVDSPNDRGILGLMLGRWPAGPDQPRWPRLLETLEAWYAVDRAEFVFNGDKLNDSAWGFHRMLQHAGWSEAAPTSAEFPGCHDPVDAYIVRRIETDVAAIGAGTLDGVMVIAHDGGYAPALAKVLAIGGAVLIAGFREELAPGLLALEREGAELLDLEYDLAAFDYRLPGRLYRPRGWAA